MKMRVNNFRWFCRCFSVIFVIIFICIGSAAAIDTPPSPPSKLNIGNPKPPPPPPPPPGNNGLLTGQTPSNYTIPSGWTLVKTQDFEGTVNEVKNGIVNTDNPHQGTKSLVGTYSGDGQNVAWYYSLGSGIEHYVSFYEYRESQGRLNDEMYIGRFYVNSTTGDLAQEIIADIFGASNAENGGFNARNGRVVIEPQGKGRTVTFYGPLVTFEWGKWTQWELYYRPNTLGNNDGVFMIFMNGNMLVRKDNENLNGSINMSNLKIQVGGTYTKLTWIKTGGGCGSYIGDGQDNGPRVTNFNNPSCSNQAPPNGYVPIFKRYFDDIIIMKR